MKTHLSSRIVFLLPVVWLAVPVAAILPLRSQWQTACSNLAAGRASEALQEFHEFDKWYGEEPEVADPQFRERRIRLWALAALQAGASNKASVLLNRWMEENPDHGKYRAFLRFQLAEIYRELGNREQADVHRRRFLTEHPNLRECALIRWNWADEAISTGDYATARNQLEQIIALSALPESGKHLARAALALVELSEGSDESAFSLLKKETDKETEVLQIWRALVAPSLVQDFLAAGLPEPALEAAGWLRDPRALVQQLSGFERTFATNAPKGGIRQGIWNAHWQGQLERLKWSLSQQVKTDELSASLYPLRFRTLIAADKPRRARILGRAILESPKSTSQTLRVEGYKAIIEASLQLKEWAQAEACAAQFLQTHPEDPALPEILFLNARTAAARNDWQNAIKLVQTLMGEFPGHRSRQSWTMLCADWLLQSGSAQDALAIYESLEGATIPSWCPFIRFQQGRCHEALSDWEKAATKYEAVRVDDSAAGNLRESATVNLLKVSLKRMDESSFKAVLSQYRDQWPDGIYRGMVGNIAGTFHQRTGNIPLAISTFKEVASFPGREAGFANEQLSGLYRKSNDVELLRKHAREWIQKGLRMDRQIPDTPFVDFSLYQKQTLKAAVPYSLLMSLLDKLLHSPASLPTTACLEVIQQQWSHYRDRIRPDPGTMMEYIECMANDSRDQSNWPAFAAFQLYRAHALEKKGRHDSADTRRIEVLQAAGSRQLGETTDFILAHTAHRYDFPQAVSLLTGFLSSYPESARQPQIRLPLARRHYLDGKTEEARGLAESIVRNWPDAVNFEEAVLQLATWFMDNEQHEQAIEHLDHLLARPGLPPETTAKSLFLRARCDFHSRRIERGFLDCLRILSLYPDIHDASEPARALICRELDRLPDRQLREKWTYKISQALPGELFERAEDDEC